MTNYLEQNLDKFHRLEPLEKTLTRLKQGLHDLNLMEEIRFKEDTNHLISANMTIPTLRAFSNGKGITKLMAEVSAYAEMIERISAGLETGLDIEPYIQLSDLQSKMLQKFNTYTYVKGYKLTHQDNIPSVIGVENFLRNENFEKEDFEFLKMKSELLRYWIPGQSLIHKKEVFVPPMFVKWIAATNGLASGNTIEEATLHACYEIFERFALISFLKNTSYHAPTINNSSIENETIKDMIKFFENHNFCIEIKDISFNGIFPTYAVLFFNKNISPNFIMYNTIKAGASFNNEAAIIRCFTERLQGTDIKQENAKWTLQNTNIYENDYLPLFFKGICPTNLDKYCSKEKIPFIPQNENNLDLCINKCIDIVKLMKTDLIVINHTHPVLNFPTVRVIMPGLSDFIKWWDPKRVTRNFLGNYNSERENYQDKLFKVINSFF